MEKVVGTLIDKISALKTELETEKKTNLVVEKVVGTLIDKISALKTELETEKKCSKEVEKMTAMMIDKVFILEEELRIEVKYNQTLEIILRGLREEISPPRFSGKMEQMEILEGEILLVDPEVEIVNRNVCFTNTKRKKTIPKPNKRLRII